MDDRKTCPQCLGTCRWPIGSNDPCVFCGGEGWVTLAAPGEGLGRLLGPIQRFDLPLTLRLAMMLAGIAGGLAAHYFAELPATPPWHWGSAALGALLGWSLPEGLTRIAVLIFRLAIFAAFVAFGIAFYHGIRWYNGIPIPW